MTGKMEITSRTTTKTHRFVLIGVLCGLAYMITRILDLARALTGADRLFGWGFAIAMTALTLRCIFFLFETTSRHLTASKPPTLVTTRTWFGKFTTRKQLEIKNSAWVRARRESMETDLLIVEVGTYGYQTTAINWYPYSENNIPLATGFCTEVAEFLRLEDKGYVNYA